MSIQCRYCGSGNTFYQYSDDGGGDYGDSVFDLYFCSDCESEFEEVWMSIDDESDDDFGGYGDTDYEDPDDHENDRVGGLRLSDVDDIPF